MQKKSKYFIIKFKTRYHVPNLVQSLLVLPGCGPTTVTTDHADRMNEIAAVRIERPCVSVIGIFVCPEQNAFLD